MKKKKKSDFRRSELKKRFLCWMDGDLDLYADILSEARVHDDSREKLKEQRKAFRKKNIEGRTGRRLILAERASLSLSYMTVAFIACITLIVILLYTVSLLPRYGAANPRHEKVVERYVEEGLEETGAVNVVAGMILDYRAFDTLGESHVLFTALICVMIMLRKDKKNMLPGFEDYHTINYDRYYSLSHDAILCRIGTILFPSIMLFGLYIILNGQVGPGGGFSGGAILGAGMIIFSSAFGFERADRFFTMKFMMRVSFAALAFYSFAKGYVFFTGANHLENHIPKGTPGAILSGGLILPLDIAVGTVVACTMFGIYSLFRRGNIGSD